MSRTLVLAALAVASIIAVVALHFASDRSPKLLLPTLFASAGSAAMAAATAPFNDRWNYSHMGQECCEANLAAEGANVYALLPSTESGSQIFRSSDQGLTWTRKYPQAGRSMSNGLEGDLQAYGDEVLHFGTLVYAGLSAYSRDRGETWTRAAIPVASAVNDQAWSYLGPLADLCPPSYPQTAPYVLAGWFRIGTEVLFSCDGGQTWPIHTPLDTVNGSPTTNAVEINGSAPTGLACFRNAAPPGGPADARVADAAFARQKAGRHGAFGTDRRFYWTTTDGGRLFVCRTADFGTTWEGNVHAVAAGPASNYALTHAAFDANGTLYVLHGDKMYVSFNQGRSFRFVHTLPRFGNATHTDSGAGQYSVLEGDKLHFALNVTTTRDAPGEIWYLTATALDTATPAWSEELVDRVGNTRLDFMQIAVDGRGMPSIAYASAEHGVTVSTRKATE